MSNIQDYNKDGVIDEADNKVYSDMIKSKSQLYLACISLLSIIGVMLILFTNWVSIERIQALETILEFFFVINGAIIAAWFGLDSISNISVHKNK